MVDNGGVVQAEPIVKTHQPDPARHGQPQTRALEHRALGQVVVDEEHGVAIRMLAVHPVHQRRPRPIEDFSGVMISSAGS